MIKYGVLMSLPDGKLPGFYAQIVKGLAAKANLFDRDKEMLIVDTEHDRDAVVELLIHYKVEYETMELTLLPEAAQMAGTFEDYGFTSRAGNSYLYNRLTLLFTFEDRIEDNDQTERHMAVLQMEEHIIAKFAEGGATIYAVDRQLDELIGGIAKAYRCNIRFLS